MDVLVVGGSGFIGTALSRALAERGHAVTALSRSPDPDRFGDGIATARGDVTDSDSIESAFEGRDAVVNLVALSPLFEPDGGEFLSFTKLLTTPYLTGLAGGGRTRFQPIWIGDLVPLLAAALADDDYRNGVYEFGGPGVLTLADVTKLVYGAEGTPVVVLPPPMALARIGLTIGEVVPGRPMGLDQYRSLRFDNTVEDNDVERFGGDIDDFRTLSEYLGVAD